MKKLLLIILPFIFTVSVTGQAITDTGALRTQINTDIVPNAAGGITATKLNRLLLGNINAIPKLSWGIAGTSGSSATTHFIGTTDTDSLTFKVNNEQSGMIDLTNRNTSFGYQAMLNTAGSSPDAIRNTAFGYQALTANTTGSQNTGIGYLAGGANTTGDANTAIGYEAGYATTTGTLNVSLGGVALFINTTGSFNTALGYSALFGNNGSRNTAVGESAMLANTSGDSSTAVGSNALRSATTAKSNTAVGAFSLYSATGAYNTAIGKQAGYNISTGHHNTIIGDSTALGLTTGSNNTIIGSQITGLTSSLSGNIILADGAGNIKAQHDGSNWFFTGNAGIGTSTAAKLLTIGTTDPVISLKQTTSAQEWEMRVGVGTGVASGVWNLKDVTANKYAITANSNRVIIGNPTSAYASSTLYVKSYTSTGSNIDAQPDSAVYDEGNIEVMKSDYSLGEGIALRGWGNVGAAGTAMGYLKKNMGILDFTNDYNLIRTNNNHSLRFGVNDVEKMALDSTGSLVMGATAANASAILDINSTTQGVLLPRMTATQGSAITPVNGLVIYVTNTNGTFTSVGFWGYENGAWIKL